MKVSIQQSVLKQMFQMASRCTMGGKSASYHTLGNLKVWTDGNMLCVGATNLETGIVIRNVVEVAQAGATTVPAVLATAFVANLQDGDVFLELKKDRLTITGKGNRGTFKTISVEDYPTLQGMPESLQIEGVIPTGAFVNVNGSGFRQAIKNVSSCAAEDESRPILCGINFIFRADEYLTMAAADGFRLGVHVIPIDGILPIETVTVPVRSMLEVARLPGDNISMSVNETRAFFWSDNISIESQIINGKFPDYNQIIPVHDHVACLDTEELKQALKVARVFFKNDIHMLDLHLEGDKLQLMANLSERGECIAELDAEWIPDRVLDISFNGKFLQDAIDTIRDDFVSIYFGSSSQPGYIKSADGSWRCVIMPMHNAYKSQNKTS